MRVAKNSTVDVGRCRSRAVRAGGTGRLIAVALCAALGAAMLPGAHAQQGGQSLQGGGQGAGSGGNTGGVASPSGSGSAGTTAGASTGRGSPSGTSRGPGPTNQNRFGGEAPAPVPPPGPTPPPTAEIPSATDDPSATSNLRAYLGDSGSAGEDYVLGRGGRCQDYELGRMTVEQRIAGANLERLNAAEAYLAPDFTADAPKTPIYILANYQQELEQAKPSLTLAGTYLGLVATRRVTSDVVVRVNNLLCLSTAPSQAESISQMAETQRLAVR